MPVLARSRAVLVVVDVQEAFRAAIDGFDAVAANTAILVQGAQSLGVPVVVTEQYPQGLGETVPEIAVHLDGVVRHPKTVFSAAAADGFDLDGRDHVLLCGIETHVCVNQTALDLLGRGVAVDVAVDAVGSRTPENKALGLDRMAGAGATRTSTETALFELLGRAGTPEFKVVQGLVK